MSDFAGLDNPFGEFDIEEIPESILRGNYTCDLSRAEFFTDEKDEDNIGRKYWVVDFTVDGSKHPEFSGETTEGIFINLFTKMTQEKFNSLPAEIDRGLSQKRVRESIKFYKKIAKQLGFSPDEIKMGADFKSKVGQKYLVPLYADRNGRTRANVQEGITAAEKSGNDSFDDF